MITKIKVTVEYVDDKGKPVKCIFKVDEGFLECHQTAAVERFDQWGRIEAAALGHTGHVTMRIDVSGVDKKAQRKHADLVHKYGPGTPC
jgi:hypothetical protein